MPFWIVAVGSWVTVESRARMVPTVVPGPRVDMGPHRDQRVDRGAGAGEGDVAVDHDQQPGVSRDGHLALDTDHDRGARRRVEGQALPDPDQDAPFIAGTLGSRHGRERQHQRQEQDRHPRQESGHDTTSGVQRSVWRGRERVSPPRQRPEGPCRCAHQGTATPVAIGHSCRAIASRRSHR